MSQDEATPTSSSERFIVPWTLAVAPTNVDFQALNPSTDNSIAPGHCCRQLIVGNPTGPIVVTPKVGANITIPLSILLNSPVLTIKCKALVAAGSSNCDLMALW